MSEFHYIEYAKAIPLEELRSNIFLMVEYKKELEMAIKILEGEFLNGI